MKALLLPIVEIKFVDSLGKTAITCKEGNEKLVTVWANGNQNGTGALLANIVVNEIGDTFVATSDSKVMGADGKTPIFKKGDVVKRQKQTEEFKSFAGNNSAAQFAQSAGAFGLQLNVIMQG
jgi:hypothetical protein